MAYTSNTVVRQRSTTMEITCTPSRPGYPVSKHVVQGELREGWGKDTYRTDPIGRFYQGPYRYQTKYTDVPSYVIAGFKARTYETVPHTYTYTVLGTGIGYLDPPLVPLLEHQKSRAVLINNALRGAREQLVNLAMFIGELNKSMDMMSDKASRISSAAGDIRKGKFAKAARTLGIRKPKSANRNKSFANNWLEFSYGWAPIVSDIAGTLRHIHRGSRTLLINARSRQTTPLRKFHYISSYQIEEAASQHHLLVNWRTDQNRNIFEQVHLVFRPTSNFWDQVSRLGFMDPATLAVDAVPLSFVLGWFVNISDLLSDMNRGLTLDYVTGSYTEYQKQTNSVTGTCSWNELKYNQFSYSGFKSHVTPVVSTEVFMNRTVLSPQEIATTLVLQVPSSVNQAITAVALAVQRLK